MTQYTIEEINHGIELVRQKAESIRLTPNAKIIDQHGADLLGNLDIFMVTWGGESSLPDWRIPQFFRPFLEQARKEIDPEYQEYQRLKEKFEI